MTTSNGLNKITVPCGDVIIEPRVKYNLLVRLASRSKDIMAHEFLKPPLDKS